MCVPFLSNTPFISDVFLYFYDFRFRSVQRIVRAGTFSIKWFVLQIKEPLSEKPNIPNHPALFCPMLSVTLPLLTKAAFIFDATETKIKINYKQIF